MCCHWLHIHILAHSRTHAVSPFSSRLTVIQVTRPWTLCLNGFPDFTDLYDVFGEQQCDLPWRRPIPRVKKAPDPGSRSAHTHSIVRSDWMNCLVLGGAKKVRRTYNAFSVHDKQLFLAGKQTFPKCFPHHGPHTHENSRKTLHERRDTMCKSAVSSLFFFAFANESKQIAIQLKLLRIFLHQQHNFIFLHLIRVYT